MEEEMEDELKKQQIIHDANETNQTLTEDEAKSIIEIVFNRVCDRFDRRFNMIEASHNGVSGELAQYRKQADTWYLEVYQFVLKLSNRMEQLESKFEHILREMQIDQQKERAKGEYLAYMASA